MSLKLGRRSFLSSMGIAGASLFGNSPLFAATTTAGKGGLTGSMSSPGYPHVDGSPVVPIKSGLGSTGNPWAELGVIPVVNSGGTFTVIGGSVMKPEVIELIRMGNMHFAVVDDLEMKAGEWLAKLCKQPEGYTGLVVNGAAHAAVIGYAGMMTEDYNERIHNIPDLRNFPKTEVIIQQAHTGNFDHQIRQTGAKLVVVNSREEMIAAINERTVAIHYLNISPGPVNGPDTVAIARQHNIYTFCDASADVPPKERLWEFPAIGFDMVTFSGGKDICGPQAAGLLFGKKELIRYSLLNTSPQENTIGRASKVGKETLFGLLKAVELFVTQDYSETLRKYDAKAKTITDALAPYGVTANPRQFYIGEDGKATGPAPNGNVSPHYSWTWDADAVKITSQEITKKLSETLPVAIGNPPSGGMGAGGMSGRPDPNWTGPYDSDGGRAPGAPRGGGAAGGRGARGAAAAPGAAGAAGAGGGRGGRGAAAAGAPGATAPAVAAGAATAAAPAGRGGGRGPNSLSLGMWLLKDGEDKYIANRLVVIFEEAGIKKVSKGKVPVKAAAAKKA